MNSVRSARRYSIAWLLAAALAALLSLGQLPAVAVGTASISGTVSVPAGTDPMSIFIDAVPAGQDGAPVVSTQPAADGSYTLSGLDAGSYKIFADPGFGSAVEPQWYNGQYSFATATAVSVTNAQARTGINLTLVAGASISGLVTGPAGVDLTDVLVIAHDDAMDVVSTAAVGADGTYRVSGLPAGTYRLNFTTQDSGLEPEWYNNQSSFDTATAIRVARGEAFTADPAQMQAGGSISGTVTVPTGVDPAEVRVSISHALNEFQWAGNAAVNSDGTYSVTGLPAGSYKLHFTGGAGVTPMWYGGQSTFEAATAVAVAASASVPGINVNLSAAATISGTVAVPTVPAPYVINDLTVAAHNTDTGTITPTYVLPDGSYTVGPLAAGSYKLHFVDGTGALKAQWFAGRDSQDTADVLTVTDGQALTGQNITMAFPALPFAANVTPPAISGQALVGETLSVTAGTWNPAAAAGSLSYVWLRNNAAIPGATGSTYVPTVDDAGQEITVQETMTAPGYQPSRQVSAPVTPTGTFASVTAPKLVGTAAVGYTVRALVTMPTPAATTVRYRWYRNGTEIAGAYASSYKLTALDAGKQIRAKAFLYRPGFTTATSLSAAVVPVAAFTGLKAPVVIGTAAVGYTVRASVTMPTPAATTIRYRWYRNGAMISGAYASSYKLTTLDAGKQIRTKAFFYRPGYAAATSVSAAIIPKSVFTGLKAPVVSGITAVGYTLKSSYTRPVPAPSALAYRWLRNGVVIPKAYGATYKLTALDRGKQIRSTVYFFRAGYLTAGVVSAYKLIR